MIPSGYAGYLKTWIVPAWGNYSLSDVKAVEVEAWLKTVERADGTKAKLRNIMHALFNHAMRWEFFRPQPDHLGTSVSKADPDSWKTAVYLAVTTRQDENRSKPEAGTAKRRDSLTYC